MKKYFTRAIALLGWFAVIAQYVLMLHKSVVGAGETTLRFFSYFTILSNTAITLYFSALLLYRL